MTNKNAKKTCSRWLMCGIIVVAITIGALISYNIFARTPGFTDDTVMVTVNGFPITLREFRQSVASVRAEALTPLISQGANQADSDFWNVPINGVTPFEAVVESALAEAVHRKIIQIMALEYGLIDDISYASFLADIEAAQAGREEDIAYGRAVFGAVHEQEHHSFALAVSNLEGDVRIHTAHIVQFTQDELYQAYREIYSQFPVNPGFMHMTQIFMQFQPDSDTHREFARIVMESIYELIKSGMDFYEAAALYEYLVDVEEIFIDLRRGEGQDHLRPLIWAAYGMEPDTVYGIIEHTNGYGIIHFHIHDGVRYAPFTEIVDIVHSRKAADYYEAKLRRLIDEAIVLPADAFDRIGLEDVLGDN